MKIATILGHSGLTLPQYGALRSARNGPLHRVRRSWRERGSRKPVHPASIAAVAARGLLEIRDETAVLTDAGTRLLADVEGRR